jgi:cell division protease FtsH
MSDLGPIALGDNQDTVFLGRDITRSQHLSEDTARQIDQAISELINGQYARAEQIISEHRTALDKVAQALLEHETIEGRHVLEILKDGEIKSPIVMVRQPPRQPPEAGKLAPKAAPDAAGGGSPAPSPA